MEQNYLVATVLPHACLISSYTCQIMNFLFTDDVHGIENMDAEIVFLGHFPAGTSLRNLELFG